MEIHKNIEETLKDVSFITVDVYVNIKKEMLDVYQWITGTKRITKMKLTLKRILTTLRL